MTAVVNTNKSTHQSWHHFSANEVGHQLKANFEKGLSFEEITARRDRFSFNQLTVQKQQNIWLRFLQHGSNFI